MLTLKNEHSKRSDGQMLNKHSEKSLKRSLNLDSKSFPIRLFNARSLFVCSFVSVSMVVNSQPFI